MTNLSVDSQSLDWDWATSFQKWSRQNTYLTIQSCVGGHWNGILTNKLPGYLDCLQLTQYLGPIIRALANTVLTKLLSFVNGMSCCWMDIGDFLARAYESFSKHDINC